MTREEFREQRAKIDRLKKDLPELYRGILEQYTRYKLAQLKNSCLIDVLYYELENVKGVDLTKERSTYNHDAHIEKYYSISDRITAAEKEQNFINACLTALEKVKDSIQDPDIKAIATECYFNDIYG